MTLRKRHLAAAASSMAILALAACSGSEESLEGQSADLVADGLSHRWIYTGTLPALEKPELTVSLKAHTVRVSGYISVEQAAQLPFYAHATVESSPDVDGVDGEPRVRLDVVYPVATGKNGNNVPDEYGALRVLPFVRNTDTTKWGGFPFLKYHMQRGFAFHGPIDVIKASATSNEWYLVRGPVSKGCQRMQGEHVVEMTHMLGIDMSKPHAETEVVMLNLPLHVIEGYDAVDGKFVDVDYPARPDVVLPAESERVLFPTWDSRDLPELVCTYDKNRPLDATHCQRGDRNKFDPMAGPPDGWESSTPTADEIIAGEVVH